MFTIEDAKRVQRDLDLGDRHIAFVNRYEGFVLAHTDTERASGMNLADCEIHHWLSRRIRRCCFPALGWYEIIAVHKARGLAL